MMKPINTASDGTIFINFLKPAGKILYRLKHAPPNVTVVVLVAAGAAAAAGIGYFVYRKLWAK